MMDNSSLREKYSQMSNEQLLHWVKSKGHEMTSEVLDILQDIFKSRNLDTSIFDTIKANHQSKLIQNIEEAKAGKPNELIDKMWDYAFSEKKQGKTSLEIHKGLLANGLDEELSSQILNNLESKGKELLKVYEKNMSRNGIICIIGIVITLGTYIISLDYGGTYIITWGAVVFGAIRYFQSKSHKEDYEIILSNIETETNNSTISGQ